MLPVRSSTSISERTGGWRFFLLGLAGLPVLLELLLQVMPVSSATMTGRYLDPLITTYPPHHEWTESASWALQHPHRMHANNVGFVAHRDFVRNPDAIALIGDSFVEASALDEDQRPDYQLEQALKSRPVYGMGVPGTALLDYAERMRYAREHYGLHDFVLLLEPGDLRQSICGSGNIDGPCLSPGTLKPQTEVQPPPGLLKRIFRHSALAQYLLGHLQIMPTRLWDQAVAQARGAGPDVAMAKSRPILLAPQLSPAEQAVANAFFERVGPLLKEGRLVLMLGTDRQSLYAGHPETIAAMQGFALMARAQGARIVDPMPLFTQQYREHGLKFDVSSRDGHLNPLGVHLVAQAAAAALLEP